ncbi:hypothetical protein PNK_0272 [Candidatus Protochlamydia naegleriophila]|uniref:Glycosyltransferase 2-like domain-containing protein n=1 Tax=Candidatus Protochlamydia naegleriophila TaxID=389348 RepID=A0A0U5JDG7_9BACT|nr:hypothetical protein [Candidatus Protochlamydia naegleriophila]CUI15909.1 hypothetical protein PNK_0272 [Candidatus Protochlamydia naegleriophila]
MRNKKIPCFVLIYSESNLIKNALNNLVQNKDLDIYVIENKSLQSSENQLFCLDLLHRQLITNYILFDENISNNAFEVMIKRYKERIKVAEYVLVTDGDLTVQDANWLSEEVEILNKHPEVFVCGVKLSLQNLPLKAFPESKSWVPEPTNTHEAYTEQLSGIHLTLWRSKEFIALFEWMQSHGKPFLDGVIHQYCAERGMKWAVTRQAEAVHLTWDIYADLEHPYVKAKLSKPLHKVFNHNNYCAYTVYRVENGKMESSRHGTLSIFNSIKRFVCALRGRLQAAK